MINESNKNLLKAFPVLKQIPESELDTWYTKYITPMETVIASYMKNIIYTNRGIGYILPDGYIWEIKSDDNGTHITIVKGKADDSRDIHDIVLVHPEAKLYSVFSYDENDLMKIIDNCKVYTGEYNHWHFMGYFEPNYLYKEYEQLADIGYDVPYVHTESEFNLNPESDPRPRIRNLCKHAKYSIDDFIIKDSKKIPDMIAIEKAKDKIVSEAEISNNSTTIPVELNVGFNHIKGVARELFDKNSTLVSSDGEKSKFKSLFMPSSWGVNNNGIAELLPNKNSDNINIESKQEATIPKFSYIGKHHIVLENLEYLVRENGFGVHIVPAQFQLGLLNVFVLDKNGVPLFDRSFMIDIQGATLDPRPKWYPVAESPNMKYKGMIEFVFPAYVLTNKKGEYVAEKDISSFINGKYSQDGNNYRRLYSDEEMSMFSWFAYRSLLRLDLDDSVKIKIMKTVLKVLTNSCIKETINSVQDIPLFYIKEANEDKFVIVSEKSNGLLHEGVIEIICDEKEKNKVCMNIL